MKKYFSIIFKLLIVLVAGWGLILNFKMASFRESIIYFTIQSNLICFLVFLGIIILEIFKKLKKEKLYYIIKGMATINIILTMAVFELLLATSCGFNAYENHALEANLLHLVVPILVILDYMIFDIKGKFDNKYPLLWSIPIILYQLFVIIYSCMGYKFADNQSYPYFFMNIDEYGFIGCTFNCVSIYVIYLLIGYIIVLLDNKVFTKNIIKKEINK